jgi:hypothetical protein
MYWKVQQAIYDERCILLLIFPVIIIIIIIIFLLHMMYRKMNI